MHVINTQGGFVDFKVLHKEIHNTSSVTGLLPFKCYNVIVEEKITTSFAYIMWQHFEAK